MADRRMTLAEVMAANPRQQGENPLAYQQRVGQLQWTQGQTPENTVTVPLSATAPQTMNEPAAVFGLRQGLAGIGDGISKGVDWFRKGLDVNYQRDVGQPFAGAVSQAFNAAADTPAAMQQRQQQAKMSAATALAAAQPARMAKITGGAPAALGNGDIHSYKDPRWTGMEQDVERMVGLPAGALSMIRTKGERSNMDQTNEFGTKGVYQITAKTRQLIQAKYKFDPWESPSSMAKGAALILKEGMDRTGSLEGGVRQYIGGTNPANYGDQTAAYVQRVMGGVAAGGGLQNPFDPKYAQAAIGELNKGEAAAMRPTSTSFDLSGMPEMPKPQLAAPTDFAASDAAFAAAKPVEMAEKDKYQTQVDGWFSGLGQALMGLEDGAGLGRVLAAVGGGAMAGVSAAGRELRARNDKFNEQMAQYNMASASREMGKAQQLQAEMQHNVDVLNTSAINEWKTNADIFLKNNYATVQGDAVVTSKMGGDGKVVLTRTPIASAVHAAFATQRASILNGLNGEYNAGNRMVAQQYNGLLMSAAGQAAAMSVAGTTQDDAAGGAVLGAAGLASALVETGRVGSVVGDPKIEEALNKEVMTILTQRQMTPGTKEYAEAFKQIMAERLTAAIIGDDKFRQRAVQFGTPAQATMAAQRQADAKTTVTRNSRGVTTREQY